MSMLYPGESGRTRSPSVRLEMDYANHRTLTGAILTTSRQLTDTPSLEPSYTHELLAGVEFAGIATATPSFASMETKFTSDKIAANVCLSSPGDPLKFHYVPGMDIWQQSIPNDPTPLKYLDNSSVINVLGERLDTNIFESFMDSVHIDSREVIKVLANYLRPKAKHRTVQNTYSTFSPYIHDVHFASGNTTRLSIETTDKRRTHCLGVSAVYATAHGNITKTYSYSVAADRHKRAELNATGSGQVVMSSETGISPDLLGTFAFADQAQNDPYSTLSRGIADLQQLIDDARKQAA